MPSAKTANTSIHLESKLKMKAQLFGMRNKKSLTVIINEAVEQYLKDN